MDNNEIKEPTNEQKVKQAGTNAAKTIVRGAANHFAGPLGGAIANKIMQTKLGQTALNNAGKTLSQNPLNRHMLSKNQMPLRNTKPLINSAMNGGGSSSNLEDNTEVNQNDLGSSNIDETSISNAEQNKSNNSGFGSNKSGLFSTSDSSSNEENNGTLSGSRKKSKNTKKIVGIVGTSISFAIVIFFLLIIVTTVVSQIMIVRDNITKLAQNFTTGIEKVINFAQGDGWMTNEDSFFNYLDEQYNAFEKFNSGSQKLDVPLIAATIHYSKMVDLGQYEETEGIEDPNYTSADFEQLGTALTKDQTVSFYRIAKEKLGSTTSIYPGQKRLLGHLSNIEVKPGFYDYYSAKTYWENFFNYALQVTVSTGMDIKDETILNYAAHPITSFMKLYQELSVYKDTYGDITYGLKYDEANNIYELEEFLDMFRQAYNDATTTGEMPSQQPEDDSGTWFSIKITANMNYGYDEYKAMNQDMLEMRAILTRNNISFDTDDDVLNQARNSSDSALKTLYDDYIKNENKYLYSYTHYLQNVYVPFTYFYNQEYSKQDVDGIIDEIYAQRDFYNYLVGEEESSECSGSCVYPVNGEEVNNLKVRLLQCADETRGEPIVGEELVDFEKYILGVVYGEIGPDAPVEAAKTQAIAARSFALSRPKEMGYAAGLNLEKEGDTWVLSIRNCVEDQVYCDPDRGCSSILTPTGYNSVTMYSGANTKADKYKDPLPEDAPIRSAVAEVTGQVLLDEDGNIVPTGYTNTNQSKWKRQANAGMDYTEILMAEYEDGKTISKSLCSNVCNKATGDYTQWKQFNSLGAPWGNIKIYGPNVCGRSGNRECNINNIGCLATSVAIQVARSGIPVQNINGEFNPGTFVEGIKPEGFTGASFTWNISKVAPTFIYHGKTILNGDSQTTKVAKIQSLIDQGCYLVMEVKRNGGGEHWVAVDYVEGNRVYMMDPASTEVDTWKKYPHWWTSQVACYKVAG